MEATRSREIKDLVNSLFFLMNRQNFHKRQIDTEEKRFHRAVQGYSATYKKMQHICHMRDYQEMMAENSRQMQIYHEKLRRYLELNDDLKHTKLYRQADEVLKTALLTIN